MTTEQEIKVSVVVTTYNQQDTIARTLDSILRQECGFDYEIVIGEDCSTDGTLAVCREYARRFNGKIRLGFTAVNFRSNTTCSREIPV